MIRPAQYLKPAWLGRLFDSWQPLLPAETSLGLVLGGKTLFSLGPANGTPINALPANTLRFDLKLDDEPVGLLWLLPPPGTEKAAHCCAAALAFCLQSQLEAEHARRQVGQETLDAYREMALLQRVVADLNRSLKASAVADALLREFIEQKDGADFGAVLIRDENGVLATVSSFGQDANDALAALQTSALFRRMSDSPIGDIVDDITKLSDGLTASPVLRSLLWLPLIAHEQPLGLLILGAKRPEAFTANDMKRAQTLSSVAATAIHNARLYEAEQRMFQAFVRVIATAIDAKSPFTAGHCRRVPEIALKLADAAHEIQDGPFADFSLSEDDRNALEIAAMLHDCGKVVTPEWIIDKASRLDAIVDRIELIALRFDNLRHEARHECLQAQATGLLPTAAEEQLQQQLQRIDEDQDFIEKCNCGSVFIDAANAERIRGLAAHSWRDRHGALKPLLTEDEVFNLLTPRGTLNANERKIIEDHAVHTLNMLSQIPFPQTLRNVTEYAACHHERLDGSGYPRHLDKSQLSIPARIVAIADIFEALTAPDRPYRKSSTLDWALGVMQNMKKDGHIDAELFDLFVEYEIHLDYARRHLLPEAGE